MREQSIYHCNRVCRGRPDVDAMKETSNILAGFESLCAEGKPAALATVVAVCGSAYRRPGARMLIAADGRAWVAEADGSVVGSVACQPARGGVGLELQMLYVIAPWRRLGLGSGFVGLVESETRRRGQSSLELWSDTRFLDAHRLYRSLGFEQLPDVRELHDLSDTREYLFRKSL